eukprot:jgi/Tetstr1/423477/TSEL_014158.t1
MGPQDGGEEGVATAAAVRMVDSSGPAADSGDDSGVQYETASSVAAGLSAQLRLFGWAQLYTIAVRCVRVACFYAGVLGVPAAVTRSSTINNVAAACSFASAVLWELSTFVLTRLAAGKAQTAASEAVKHYERGSLAGILESLCLCLSAVFNTFAASIATKVAMELVQATVLYSEMLVVLAVSVLVLSILWVAGFIGTQLWFSNTNKGNNANNVKLSNTRHVSQAVNASIVELQEVPVLVRFSIRVIFGRFRPHKRTEIAAAAQDGKKRYIFQLEHYEDLRFTPEQLHIIKLVHEAMASAVVWLAVRLYTCLLLIGTYILESLWSQLINDAIDLAKTVILLVMLTKSPGGGGPQPLWESVQEKGKALSSNMLKRAQSIKIPEVPAELEPTITSARQKTVETWARLPGPVQAALPFVAVGATVAFGVKLVSDRALFQEKVKSMRLESQLQVVTTERDQLRARVTTLNNLTDTPRSERELRMARAISEATQAAAAASQAAALAAQSCATRPMPQAARPSEAARRPPPS